MVFNYACPLRDSERGKLVKRKLCGYRELFSCLEKVYTQQRLLSVYFFDGTVVSQSREPTGLLGDSAETIETVHPPDSTFTASPQISPSTKVAVLGEERGWVV